MIKKGFTLIELLVALGMFAIILVAGSGFLIETLRNANTANIQIEVRQNANSILQDIRAQIRSSSCVYYESPSPLVSPPYPNTSLIRTSDDPNGTGCKSGNVVEYYQDQNGQVTRKTINSGGETLASVTLTSGNSAVLDCGSGGSACGSQSCAKGLLASPTLASGGMPVTITLRAQQALGRVRSDFCAAVQLADTITPRVR